MFNKLLNLGKTFLTNKNSQTTIQTELTDNEEPVVEPVINFSAEEFVEILKTEITNNTGKRIQVLNFKEPTEAPLYRTSFVHNFTTTNLCQISNEYVNVFQDTNYPLNLDTVQLLVQKCQEEKQRIDEFKALRRSKVG